jgi:hypothetical protein
MPSRQKKPTLTQKRLKTKFQKKYSTLHGQYTGYTSKNVIRRPPRKITLRERRAQFLTHMATVLKGYYDSLPKRSEVEIQIALIDGGLFIISSNKDATAEYFYDSLVDKGVKRIRLMMTLYADELLKATRKSTASDRIRKQRHLMKFKSELSGSRRSLMDRRLRNEVAALYMTGRNACIHLDALNASKSDIVQFCTGALTGKKIALVTSSGKNWHAEQKILYMLVRAQNLSNLSITFSGTFRPCRGCFETLSLVKKYYMRNLRFNEHPGHFWNTTNQCHTAIFKLLVEQGKISSEELDEDFDERTLLDPFETTTYRPDLRSIGDDLLEELHYASDSDSEYEDESDVEIIEID